MNVPNIETRNQELMEKMYALTKFQPNLIEELDNKLLKTQINDFTGNYEIYSF